MKKKINKLYYIVAGEASGDLHGANLIKSLVVLDRSLLFRGVGGPLMDSQGLKSLVPFSRLAIMGFVEILKELPFFLKIKKIIVSDIIKSKPDKIILIDYPGFNLSLARAIKRSLNIPIVFYISPQVWAWNEGRIKIIKKNIDELIAVFPFEKTWFKKHNLDINYFGHPLIDTYKKNNQTQTSFPSLVGLFPGSRKQEIDYHLPLFEKIIAFVLQINPGISFVMGLAPGAPLNKIICFCKKYKVEIIKNNSWEAFNKSSVAIVASGTATLECAISNTPFVVVYKTSFISWLLARWFLSVKYISIVNILAQKMIVKEFVQYKTNPKTIALEVVALLKNPYEMKHALSAVVASLGPGKAYDGAAKHIIGG